MQMNRKINHDGTGLKIVIDTREQLPFSFHQWGEDIETARAALPTGDYSVAGLENRIAIERKSLADLVQCLGRDRTRFAKELLRARALESFCVVIESSWQDMAAGKYRSNLDPGAACASVAAFMARYHIPFFFAGSRAQAERFTVLFLRQYLRGKARELNIIRQAMGAGLSGNGITGAIVQADAHTGAHAGIQGLF